MHAGANVVGMESRRGVGRVNEGVQREREVLGRAFMKRKSGIRWFRVEGTTEVLGERLYCSYWRIRLIRVEMEHARSVV